MALDDLLIGENVGTITDGQRTTSDLGATTTGRDTMQWIQEQIVMVSKDSSPMDSMFTNRAKSGGVKKVKNAKYTHLENDELTRWVEVDSINGNGDGLTIDVTTGQGDSLQAGDSLYNPDGGEVMLISGVATDVLTISRGQGNSTASTLVDGDNLLVGPSIHEEGTGQVGGKSSEPDIKTNYCQTSKVAIEISGRLLETEITGGKELARIMRDAGSALMNRRETAYFFGALSASNPTSTGGMQSYLSTNVTNVGGVLTEAVLNTQIKTIMTKNQGKQSSMVNFTGDLIRDAIDGFARDSIRYTPKDEVYGVAVGRIRNSHGELAMVSHSLLKIDPNVAGRMYSVNMDLLKRVEFANRGWVLQKNIQTPGVDGLKHGWLTDFGFWMASEKQHGLLYGVTG